MHVSQKAVREMGIDQRKYECKPLQSTSLINIYLIVLITFSGFRALMSHVIPWLDWSIKGQTSNSWAFLKILQAQIMTWGDNLTRLDKDSVISELWSHSADKYERNCYSKIIRWARYMIYKKLMWQLSWDLRASKLANKDKLWAKLWTKSGKACDGKDDFILTENMLLRYLRKSSSNGDRWEVGRGQNIEVL